MDKPEFEKRRVGPILKLRDTFSECLRKETIWIRSYLRGVIIATL